MDKELYVPSRYDIKLMQRLLSLADDRGVIIINDTEYTVFQEQVRKSKELMPHFIIFDDMPDPTQDEPKKKKHYKGPERSKNARKIW